MTNGKKSMRKNLAFETLAFFDAEDLALTRAELENYLVHNPLNPPYLKGEENAGFPTLNLRGGEGELFFLAGRDELISQKKSKYRISLERFRKAKKYLRVLQYFPYLRAVALSGSQALLNATPESDIDLFIITKKNRIWLTRALVSAYFQILGARRHGDKIAGRFCLNHYIEEGQEISEDRNLYTAVEYASLLPVLGAENLENFWEKNTWIKEYLPNASFEARQPFFDLRFGFARRILELVLDYSIGPALNYILGVYQKHRIRKQDYILVSDSELSFHPGSRGQQILALYKSKIL